jgi:hypothetical protein
VLVADMPVSQAGRLTQALRQCLLRVLGEGKVSALPHCSLALREIAGECVRPVGLLDPFDDALDVDAERVERGGVGVADPRRAAGFG